MDEAGSENHLLCGEIKDAFASFRRLKQKCATSISPVEGAGWETTVQQGICCCKVAGALRRITKSAHTVPDALVSEVQASTPESTIDTFFPTISEVYKAMNKIKAGKAPGVDPLAAAISR